MKKFTMLSSVLASALMLTVASCSGSDDITGGNGGENAEGSTSYLVINLNSVGNAPASRAYEQGGGSYDDGEALENQISKVRFYFYNADGTAYKLQNTGTNGGAQNWIDQEVTTETGDQSVTASGKTQAVLVLNGESNVSPASMLAVVNPEVGSSQLDGNMVSRWSKMRTELTGKTFHDGNGFVMTNSTYEDGGKDLCTTQLAGRTYSNKPKIRKQSQWQSQLQ